MSASDIAISVRGLSKSYTIAHQQEKHSTLAESLLHRLRRPFQRAGRETFWALKDVSFNIQQGDVVGIVGRNGAGKSTLLKILSRITEPTTGEIELYGRVGSLLEVGTGFHPELTGRENVYLNGQILGMRKSEIDRQFDAIIDFAEVERFLDTPVKRYSSGMYVRLAFAVAAHLNPDILIVDEVLAVGDQRFQEKCFGKMRSVASDDGRTVLLISHNTGVIASLCNKALFLEKGFLSYEGKADSAIAEYLKGTGSGDAVFDHLAGSAKLELLDRDRNPLSTWRCGEEMICRVQVEVKHAVERGLAVDLALYAPAGAKLFAVQSDRYIHAGTPKKSAVFEFRLNNLGIACHELWIDLGIRAYQDQHYIAWWQHVEHVPIAIPNHSRQVSDMLVSLPCSVSVMDNERYTSLPVGDETRSVLN